MEGAFNPGPEGGKTVSTRGHHDAVECRSDVSTSLRGARLLDP